MLFGMKELCVLIINYNSSLDTFNLISDLQKSNYTNFDVLVFDNGSKEDLSNLEKIKNITFIKNNENLGFTGGVNKALNFIKSKYVLLLNPDIIIDDNALKELLDLIKNDEKIAFAAGSIYNFIDKNKVDSFGGKMNFLTGIGRPLINETEIRELKYGEYTDACILIFNKEIFQKLGSYDERYFMYVETEDIQFKAMKNCYKVFIDPKAKVWHKVYGSSGGRKSKRAVYYLTRNRFLFIKKHVNIFNYVIFLFLNLFGILPLQFLLFLKRRHFDLLGAFFLGIYDGIRQKNDRLV